MSPFPAWPSRPALRRKWLAGVGTVAKNQRAGEGRQRSEWQGRKGWRRCWWDRWNRKGRRTNRVTVRLGFSKLLHIWWSQLIGLPSTHPLTKHGMWVVKRIHFDELYTTTISDRSYDQQFKKSTFGQLSNLSRLEIKKLSEYLGYYILPPSTEFALEFFMADV